MSEAAPLHTEEEEPDRIIEVADFSWQQKVYGTLEVKRIRNAEQRGEAVGRVVGGGWLGKRSDNLQLAHERVALAALDAESASRGGGQYTGRLLHTRVASEGIVDEVAMRGRLTSSDNEQLTPLAQAVLDGSSARRHRKLAGDPHSVDMQVLAELPADALGIRSTPRTESTSRGPRRMRHGLGDRGGSASDEGDGSGVEIVTLVTLRFFSNGRLDVRPALDELPLQESGSALTAADSAPALSSAASFPTLQSAASSTTLVAPPEPQAKWHRIGASRFEFRVYNLSEKLEGEPLPGEVPPPVGAGGAHEQAKGGVAVGGGVPNVSLVPMDFSMPLPSVTRVHHFLQLESASGFGTGRICIQFFAAASPGWRLLPHCISTGATQIAMAEQDARPHGPSGGNLAAPAASDADVVTLSSFGLAATFVVITSAACAAVAAAAINSAVGPSRSGSIPPSLAAFLAALAVALVALAVGAAQLLLGIDTGASTRRRNADSVLALPLEFALETVGTSPTARPPLSLFLSVLRVEPLGKHTHLGYAQVVPPARAGESVQNVRSFRLALSRAELLDDLLVGGIKELNDLRALGIPAGFDSACLNKYGLQTATGGSITVRTHTVVHQQPDLVGAAGRAASGAGTAGRGSAARASTADGSRKSATFRAIAGARSLGGAESAADRVRKRLQERRESERAASGRASAALPAASCAGGGAPVPSKAAPEPSPLGPAVPREEASSVPRASEQETAE